MYARSSERHEDPAAEHGPAAGSHPPYKTYRPCLRWEFGYGCAFCLTHEADLVEHGVEGTGLTSIEHQIPQSDDPGGPQVDHYTNCFYACRYCNGARGSQPIIGPSGAKLLDPCRYPWASHFARVGVCLVAMTNDADASRTHRVYDLDDPRKQAMRRSREDTLTQALQTLDEAPSAIERLLLRAGQPGDQRADLIAAAGSLRALMSRAKQDILRFLAVPVDANATCRCATSSGRSLPAFLADQTLERPE